jgi:hypothetical protein
MAAAERTPISSKGGAMPLVNGPRTETDPVWKGSPMSISRGVCWLVRKTGASGLAFGLAAGLLCSALTVPLGQGRAAAAVTAVVNTQSAVSWGFDSLGELGDGTTNSRSLFGTVDAGSGIVQVAAGLDHGLAVTSSGTVYAWGSNVDGQLGDGTTTMQTVPVQVRALTGVVAVAAGYFHSMALRLTARSGPGATTPTASWVPARQPAARSRSASRGSSGSRRSRPAEASAWRGARTAPSGPGASTPAASWATARPPTASSRCRSVDCPRSPASRQAASRDTRSARPAAAPRRRELGAAMAMANSATAQRQTTTPPSL